MTVIFTETAETLKCCVTSEKRLTGFKVSRRMFSFNNTGTGDVQDKLGAHSLTRLTDAYAGAVRPFTALTPCVVRVNT